MTKLEVIKANKKVYAEIENAIQSMEGLEKAVAENMTLAWAKGRNWLGGISDREEQKAIEKLMSMGYDAEDIMDEFEAQIMRF